MTFAEKERIWKAFAQWGKGKYFKNISDLGKKLGYDHGSWAPKMIYDARDRRSAEFPEVLWRIILCASVFGGFEFPKQASEGPKPYAEKEHDGEWVID